MKNKILYTAAACVVALAAIAAAGCQEYAFRKSCITEKRWLYLPSGTTVAALKDSLAQLGADIPCAQKLSKAVDRYDVTAVAPGAYLLTEGMSARGVAQLIASGRQTPVRLTFNNVRTLGQLAGKIGRQIEADSAVLLAAFHNDTLIARYGFDTANLIGMFLPDTYEVYWTTSPEALLTRMDREYEKFWNPERTEKLNRTGLRKREVSTLASIVYEETKQSDEMPTVAGVYINRLKLGMPLQADPTVKFAAGDFGLRRIRYKHLGIDSPYNTYKYTGLPPGPIAMPSKKAIDAVLDYRTHPYIFFCARPDYSGYHNFASTLEGHNRNARAYAEFLNREGIVK